MGQYWSWLLTAVGVFGLWLAGRKDYRGWIVGLAAQVLWIAYATATHQWGFYVSALCYGAIYLRNWLAWRAGIHAQRGTVYFRNCRRWLVERDQERVER